MTPERRRRAVCALTERFGVSERRACTVIDQHRSTQRCRPRPPRTDEAKLRRRLRQIAKTHPRWGWKMAHEILRREGWTINKKRTQRLWRHEGLRRPQRCTKRRRIRPECALERHRAQYPNHVWAIDFQFDETSDYRRLKMLNIVDEFTREALAMEVDRSITADGLVDVIERLVVADGAPEHLRMDNGPELLVVGTAGLVPVHRDEDHLHRARVSPGRTPSSSPSTGGPVTSCSTSRSSPRSPRPASLSKPGGSSTTPIGPTRRWAGSRPSSSSAGGPSNT